MKRASRVCDRRVKLADATYCTIHLEACGLGWDDLVANWVGIGAMKRLRGRFLVNHEPSLLTLGAMCVSALN